MSNRHRSLYLAVLLALIISLVPTVAFAGTTTVQGVTLTTPVTYGSCIAPGDTVTITGLTAINAEWIQAHPGVELRVKGWASGEFVLEGGARQPFFSYSQDTNQDFSFTVAYPPAGEWTVTDPAAQMREIHVDLSFEIYAYDLATGSILEYLNPGTLGSGDDWDVFCQGALPPPPPPPPANPGTGTPGYWKNHPQAWPVDSITIGEDTYSREKAIKLINSGDGDKSLTLFRAYVSAFLNAQIGNTTTCIDDTLAAAYNWLNKYEPGTRVKASSAAWKLGEPLYLQLDAYNNGLLCAPHRD